MPAALRLACARLHAAVDHSLASAARALHSWRAAAPAALSPEGSRSAKSRTAQYEALEPRQLLTAVTVFPTDGSTNSPQTQCSEERELIVTLATPESGFNAGDLTLSLSNSNGSGSNNGSASTALSGVLGTPTNPSGDEVTWIVPIIASTSYTTSTGSLDNGIYQLSVDNSGTNSVSQFFRLFGSLDGQLQLSGTGSDTTSFNNAYGESSGDPGYQPGLEAGVAAAGAIGIAEIRGVSA